MDLNTTQRLMARVFTDIAFRERLQIDPGKVGRELDLDETDLQWLATQAADEGAAFARSLIHKRRRQVLKMLPATQRTMGCAFGDMFREFAGSRDTQGVHRHLHDALAFAHWLPLQNLEPFPAWLPVVLEFERIWLEALAARRFLCIKLFRHDIVKLIQNRNPETMSYTGRPHLVLWLRRSPMSDPREYIFHPRFWPR